MSATKKDRKRAEDVITISAGVWLRLLPTNRTLGEYVLASLETDGFTVLPVKAKRR